MKNKVEKLHDKIIDSEAYFSDKLIFENINFTKLFQIADNNDLVQWIGEDRIFGLNYNYNEIENILYVYQVNSSETNKRSSDKMMKLIEAMEDIYITINTSIVISQQLKQESISYLLIIKNLTEDNIIGVE